MLDWKPGANFIFAVALTSIAAGCATRTPLVQSQPAPVAAATPAPVVAALPPAPADPVVELLAQSNRHFELGQRELAEGHLATAKTQFNRALEVLMESPAGA